MSSSSWTMRMPSTCSGTTSTGAAGGRQSTSSQAPAADPVGLDRRARRRAARDRARPGRRRWCGRTRTAAPARRRRARPPGRPEPAGSRRSLTRPRASGSPHRSVVGAGRRGGDAVVGHAAQAEHATRMRRSDDGGVGQVEHRTVRQLEEVDDVTPQRRGLPEARGRSGCPTRRRAAARARPPTARWSAGGSAAGSRRRRSPPRQ